MAGRAQLHFKRWAKAALVTPVVVGIALVGYAYLEATTVPRIVEYRLALPDLSPGTPPIRIVLISDIHVALPDMPPARLGRIVQQINRLKPDVVLIAGDFVSDKSTGVSVPTADAIRPLAGLRARWGTIAVLGNHDHARNLVAMRAALKRAGVYLIDNDAIIRGPLIIAGVGDLWSQQANVSLAAERAEALQADERRAVILLTHNPDIFPSVPKPGPLTMAGHTHGGQIVPPFGGPRATASRYGTRYAYGLINEAGHSLIVTSGLGTSVLPLRLNRPPEIALITLTAR